MDPIANITLAVYVPFHSDNGAVGLNTHRVDATCGDLGNVPPAADITLPQSLDPTTTTLPFSQYYCITGEANINTHFAITADTLKSLKVERPQAGYRSVDESSWLRTLYGLPAKSSEC